MTNKDVTVFFLNKENKIWLTVIQKSLRLTKNAFVLLNQCPRKEGF